MTPSWLKTYASYIDRHRFSTTEKLTFHASLLDHVALLKVPIIPADIMDDSSLVTVKIVVSLDEDIGKNEDSDPFFGVSDGVSFLGFMTVDEENLSKGYAPCFGTEGTSGNSFSGRKLIRKYSPRPNDSIYLGQFDITLKLNEHWGSCYTAHDGGFVKTAYYNKRLMLSKGVTLEVYKGGKSEKVGIKFMEVTVM